LFAYALHTSFGLVSLFLKKSGRGGTSYVLEPNI